ncbi:MAG: GNAT family N-acetyltransferase [Candidatus Bipolaricaulota bacterium]|nr:MAG: GNAT family N-acetyltransferase [Candidatus Bipolaricaulota bacterium]
MTQREVPTQLPECIEAERVYLRRYRLDDGELILRVARANRDHLAHYEATNALRTITTQDEADAVVRRFVEAWDKGQAFFLGAFHRSTDAFVAQVYVGPTDRKLPAYTIGFFADKDHEGMGYVSEAVRAVFRCLFHELGAHRVRLECDDSNVRSARVAERCGMVREGHLRENKRNPDGSLTGTLLYGLLRSDYPSADLLESPRDRRSQRRTL